MQFPLPGTSGQRQSHEQSWIGLAWTPVHASVGIDFKEHMHVLVARQVCLLPFVARDAGRSPD